MFKFTIKFIPIFLLVTNPLTTNHLYAGGSTSGAVVLVQPIGARASGMAEAYTSVSGDVSCVHYNPAGIAELKNKQVMFLYQRGIADDNFGICNFGLPLKLGTLATSIVYYTAGDIELIDIQGNLKTVNAQNDYLLTFSYGHRVAENISLGVNTKILLSRLIEEFSGLGFAFDVGGQYKLFNDRLSLGLTCRNIGSLRYNNVEEDPMPMDITFGSSYKIGSLLVALDIVKPRDDDIRTNMGLEYQIKEMFNIRAGYKFGHTLNPLSFGIGIKLGKYQFDYGLTAMGELGLTHKVSFSINL